MNYKPGFLLIVVAILLFGAYTPALAHGHVQAGDYDLEIGFHTEPAIQGQLNALDLFVTNTKTAEKVNGLENSLRVEAIFGASKKELRLEPQEGQDGAYTAYLIPTRTGDYTWRVFGTINGAPVDVSMTSSPTTFGSVEAQSDYEFPASSGGQSSGAPAGAALAAGAVGALLGLLGLAAGLLALRTARRKL